MAESSLSDDEEEQVTGGGWAGLHEEVGLKTTEPENTKREY